MHSAVSTLFNLPCIHTPLRFHSRDYNSRHFSGCGWLHRARNGNNTAHFHLQQQSPHKREQLSMFLLKLHRQLLNMESTQLTMHQWQRHKTDIAVESINTSVSLEDSQTLLSRQDLLLCSMGSIERIEWFHLGQVSRAVWAPEYIRKS